MVCVEEEEESNKPPDRCWKCRDCPIDVEIVQTVGEMMKRRYRRIEVERLDERNEVSRG